MHKMILSLSGLSLIAAALAAHAEPQKVYKWVDEHGVTHFSQAAPKGQKADARDMREPPKSRDAKADEAAAAKPLSPRCQQIEANLNTLKNSKVVAMDSDGDGKSENLSDEQRKAQLALAEQQKAAFCSE